MTVVQVARQTLAAYDAGGDQDRDGRYWSVTRDPEYWAGRLATTLRIVLARIDRDEE